VQITSDDHELPLSGWLELLLQNDDGESREEILDDALVFLISATRSLRQGEMATDEGVAASVQRFRFFFKKPTERILRHLVAASGFSERKLKFSWVKACMEAE
jgi:hypothetical protein